MITLSILLTLTSAQLAAPHTPVPALQAEAQPGERLRRWRERRGETEGRPGRGERQGADRRGAVAADSVIRYGDDQRQRILFFRPALSESQRNRRPALAVYVHGGGWENGEPEMVAEKPAWFRQHGWAFASVGYRMLPDAPVETQAADIGAALRRLRADAVQLGYDPDRILLFGHSAGAHLSALVSSDPQFAGDAFGAIRGTILIDGACYDVPAQIAAARFMAQRTYIPAFGTDPVRQRALSPITHAGGRDVPDWLLLFTGARDDAQAQSRSLAAALDRNRIRTQVFEVPSEGRQMQGHREINVEFGTSGYAANDAVLAIMRRVAGQ